MRPVVRSATLCLLLVVGVGSRAWAMEELEVEEGIADILPQRIHAERTATASTRQWAILPEAGYGPDTGPIAGAKFTHRDLFDVGLWLDMEATYAVLNQQQALAVSLAQPHLANDHFLIAVRGKYLLDPQREFFGLGNNEEGPDPASTHEFQDLLSDLTIGWRPMNRVALNFSVGVRDVKIRRGERLDRCDALVPCPFTPDAFPDLPGVHGGTVSHLALSLVWNQRDDIVRPTRGWRWILKVIHTDKALFSDFEFTRFIVDLGYLRSFWEQRVIAGMRIDGEWIEAPSGQVPFWELAELGGQDTMRGFFPHRFVGKGRALVNFELRALLTQFDFYNLWHVKLDGVLFGDGGRVFIDRTDVRDEFKLNSQIFDRIFGNFQYSYGGGIRVALAEALVARIDAGFSNEETGLIYLSFGQTF